MRAKKPSGLDKTQMPSLGQKKNFKKRNHPKNYFVSDGTLYMF